MAKKRRLKKGPIIFLSIMLALLLLVGGVGIAGYQLVFQKRIAYKNYVESVMNATYKGNVSSYCKMTGEKKEDAKANYEKNMISLTDALLDYYGLDIEEDSDLYNSYLDLTKKLYEKTSYEAKMAKKDETGNYVVPVEIHPANLLVITDDEVHAYIEECEARLETGYYDRYTMEEYKAEVAADIYNILDTNMKKVSTGKKTKVNVLMQGDGETYTVSENSMLQVESELLEIP